jgi:diguanylate cyclase (GGDEF)-like protein
MPRTLRSANLRIKALEKQIKNLELLVTHDPLTGLLNRRGMDEALAHHFSILARDTCAKNNFSVLNLDLDRFKGINDTYGHHIGDDVIRFFAQTLTETLRSNYDIVIRLGGDEFIVILPECNLEQAEIVKGTIKDVTADTSFNADGITLSLRTSIGVATALSPTDGKIRPIEAILKLADEDMYHDKEKGRGLRNP